MSVTDDGVDFPVSGNLAIDNFLGPWVDLDSVRDFAMTSIMRQAFAVE